MSPRRRRRRHRRIPPDLAPRAAERREGEIVSTSRSAGRDHPGHPGSRLRMPLCRRVPVRPTSTSPISSWHRRALLVERARGDVAHPDNGPIPRARPDLDGALNFTLDSDLYAAARRRSASVVARASGPPRNPTATTTTGRDRRVPGGDNPTLAVALDDVPPRHETSPAARLRIQPGPPRLPADRLGRLRAYWNPNY